MAAGRADTRPHRATEALPATRPLARNAGMSDSGSRFSTESLMERALKAMQTRRAEGAEAGPLATPPRPQTQTPPRTTVEPHNASDSSAPSASDRVSLKFWPDLAALSPELIPLTARTCALLSRRPTTVHLIARILGAQRPEVDRVVQLLWQNGTLRVISEPHPADGTAEPEAPPASEEPALPTIWSRLWHKLTT